MKVLQVLPTLSAGGAEGFVTNLGVSLSQFGMDVRFFLMAGARDPRGQFLLSRLAEAGIQCDGAGQRSIRSLKNLLDLARIMKNWQPDIVQANLYQAEVLLAATRVFTTAAQVPAIRRLTSTRIVSPRKAKVYRLLERTFEATVACSPSVAIAYSEFINTPTKSKLVTIPNGGVLRRSAPTPEEKQQTRKVLNIPKYSFVVSHIGRMLGNTSKSGLETDPKAHDVLLKAFARAFGGRPDHLLVLVGDGPLRPEVEALSKELGIAQQTRFLGQCGEPWPSLIAADLFCFPSRHEGMPNVLPEAASCELPIVASDIPEIRNIYTGNAWLLNPANDVASFASSMQKAAENYTSFAEAAKIDADYFRNTFSMEACARQYMQLYQNTLTGSI